jgi:hypothetical protein
MRRRRLLVELCDSRRRATAPGAARAVTCATVDAVTRCELSLQPAVTLDLVYDEACHDGSDYIAIRRLLVHLPTSDVARATLGASPCAREVPGPKS